MPAKKSHIKRAIGKVSQAFKGGSQEPPSRVPDALPAQTATAVGRSVSVPPGFLANTNSESVSAEASFWLPTTSTDPAVISPSADEGFTLPRMAFEEPDPTTPAFSQSPGSLDLPVESALSSAQQTAKNLLKGTLVVFSSVLEGLPVPGAKGIVDTVTKVITIFEVQIFPPCCSALDVMFFQAMKANDEALRTLNTRCVRLFDIVLNPLRSKNKSDISPEFHMIIEHLNRYCGIHSLTILL
jgi:hypothetical protein